MNTEQSQSHLLPKLQKHQASYTQKPKWNSVKPNLQLVENVEAENFPDVSLVAQNCRGGKN